MKDYIVYSGNCEAFVRAANAEEAALKATKLMFEAHGKSLILGGSIITSNKKDIHRKTFPTIAILQDLGYYKLAEQMDLYFRLTLKG